MMETNTAIDLFNYNNVVNLGKPTMQNIDTEVKIVTPSFAKALLGNNFGNRDVRVSHVKSLSQAIKRGAWKLSPQGIIVHKSSGRLLDGQHRLHAVVEANMDVPMFIIYTDDEEIFRVLDQGVKRTMSDVFDVDCRVMDVVNFCTRLMLNAMDRVSPHQVEPVLKSSVGNLAKELIDYCPVTRKGFSTAPFKAAAILSIIFGSDKQYVFDLYKNFVHYNLDDLPSVGKAFLRQLNAGSISFMKSQYDGATFLKFLKVFDDNNKNLSVIRLSSDSEAQASISGVSKKLKTELIKEGSITETWGMRL